MASVFLTGREAFSGQHSGRFCCVYIVGECILQKELILVGRLYQKHMHALLLLTYNMDNYSKYRTLVSPAQALASMLNPSHVMGS